MNRIFFLREPLSRALGLLAATLMLNACERVWDNPADPEAPSYQGYTSVKTADEIEAVTSDGTEMIYQSFLVNEVLEAQAYRLEIATDKQFSNVIYMKDTLTINFLGANASLPVGTYYWRGSAKKDGVWGKWTGGRGFKLVSSITSMNPASGISTTDTTPAFSWTAVAGATRYEIQIADSAADLDLNPTVDDKNVSGTSYTPTALTNKQTHHWRVRAVDGDGQAGAWSGTQTLNINFDTVSGLNPANGSTTTDITPEFSWTAVVGATRYEIQIADSAVDLDLNPTVDDKNVTGTSYTPTALTNQQLHHWRVRAVDGDGQAGAWSRTQELNVNFETVSGLNPASGISTTDTTPEFSWTAVAGAAKYEIQIADSAASLEINPTVDDKNVSGTSYTPKSALTNLHLHHWRVRAVDSEGQAGAWSGSSSLRVEIGAVSGLNPADGSSTTDITPEFSWTAVAGATRYEIQIADSAADLEINPTVDDKNVPGTSYTPAALTNKQTHHWRVRAVDGDGQAGAWSGTQTLNINFETVSGLNPANGSSTTDITPEFSWNAVTGASSYEIQIADSAASLAGSSTENVPGTSYTPTTALTNKQTHHWRVRAVDGDGQPGAWSGTQSLNINFDTVSGMDPADGSDITNITPEFSWNAVAGADKYQIQVADNAANLEINPTVDDKNVPGTSYTPTTALTNLLTYHWRVRAVDSEGQAGAWSGSSSFSIFAPINYEFRLAFVGQPYSLSLANALPSVTYSASPALPDGLNLDTSTGRIHGTPTTRQLATEYSITATPTSGGRAATAIVSLFVKETAKDKDDLWRIIDEEIQAQGNTADLNLIDTSKITDMRHLFNSNTYSSDSHADYSAFNGDISGWDVSGVTDMSWMFFNARRFNGDISGWKVSSVTNMGWMFSGAHAFNGDISGWGVSNVKDMSYMFSWALAFNGNISEWDVSGVTDMSRMFFIAYAFNGDISGWDVFNVTNMSGMFNSADAFNGDISNWNVSSVTDMSEMFYSADAFNRDISEWDVSNVTNMSGMFAYARAFNGDISSWNVSGVTDMSSMFVETDAFNGDIASWNVSNVTNMRRMFSRAVAFNGDISEWNVSGVKDMSSMFNGATAFNGNISSWNVSGVTNMSVMFTNATAFNGDISKWDVSSVTDMSWMFNGARAFNRNLESWGDHLSGREVSMGEMFDSSGLENNPPSWYEEY